MSKSLNIVELIEKNKITLVFLEDIKKEKKNNKEVYNI